MKLKHDVRAIAGHFEIPGAFLHAEPCGNGHINDSYRATYRQDGAEVRYVIQRINHHVFQDPVAVMENIQRVTAHLHQKLATETDSARQTLTVIPARDGRPCYPDADGNYWRTYIFIERTRTYEAIENPAQAYEVARAFGRFQQLLTDLPAPPLHETIPDFHHTPKRFADMEKAIVADAVNRARSAKAEIEFALRRRPITGLLLNANLPVRIIHNDSKLDNVLLDAATGQGLCVIDLDTVMPGLAPYDFGDQVRSVTSLTREDERDLSKVRLHLPVFEALARGYLSAASVFLTPAEKQHLVLAGKLITFEIGVRFLADYLAGDTYFKVHREGHNLDRCRTQFKLVGSIEEREESMSNLVAGL